MKKIIELQNIKRKLPVGEETVHALRGISFTISAKERVCHHHGYFRFGQIHLAEYTGVP